MRYSDPVFNTELQNRATAALAWAIASDSRLSDVTRRQATFNNRGFKHYGPVREKGFMSTADEGLSPFDLADAFISEVDRHSIFGGLSGAVRIPLGGAARVQLGVIETQDVGEGAEKPVGRFNFEMNGGPPVKAVGQIVATTDLLKTVDVRTQDGLRQQLVSATAVSTDVKVIAAMTAGSSISGGVAELLAAISGGAPARPYIIGGYDTLVPLAGTLRDIRELGVGILVTPAAAGTLIAIDAAGFWFSDSGAEIAIAQEARMVIEDDASPPGELIINLWQQNLVAIRAERHLRFAVKAGAVAWTTVED